MLRAALPAAVRPPFPSGPCVPPGAPILREAVALAFRAGGLRRVGVLGRSPKRILVPFGRTKGTPRRRGVLTMLCIKLRAAARRPQTYSKILLLPFAGAKGRSPRRAVQTVTFR